MTDEVLRLAQAGQSALSGLGTAAQTAGYGGPLGQSALPELVGNVINAVLGLSGLVLVVLLVYGGILYLTAAGNPDQVKTAKKTMINAVIGVAIVVSSYAVSVFVISQLSGVVSGEIPAASPEGTPNIPGGI